MKCRKPGQSPLAVGHNDKLSKQNVLVRNVMENSWIFLQAFDQIFQSNQTYNPSSTHEIRRPQRTALR